jgi:hypothetical protein
VDGIVLLDLANSERHVQSALVIEGEDFNRPWHTDERVTGF